MAAGRRISIGLHPLRPLARFRSSWWEAAWALGARSSSDSSGGADLRWPGRGDQGRVSPHGSSPRLLL